MLPLGVIRSVTPAERIVWLTTLYRVSIDAGMFLGPFVSGLLGLARAGLLPLISVTAMTVVAVLLLRRDPGVRVMSPAGSPLP